MAPDVVIGAVHCDVSPRRGEGPCEAPARAPMEVDIPGFVLSSGLGWLVGLAVGPGGVFVVVVSVF